MSEFELLDRREGVLRAEADALDKESAEIRRRRDAVEEKLQRLAQARATLVELLVDDSDTCGETDEDTPDSGSANDDAACGEERGAAGGDDWSRGPRVPLGIEEAQRRAMSLLATSGRKMRARAIAEAIGEDVSTPARVETTRGRLKTLVAEGSLVEHPAGVFFIAAPGCPDDSGPDPEEAG